MEGDEQLESDSHGLLVGVFPVSDEKKKGRWYVVAGKGSKDPKIGRFDNPLQAARKRRDHTASVPQRASRR